MVDHSNFLLSSILLVWLKILSLGWMLIANWHQCVIFQGPQYDYKIVVSNLKYADMSWPFLHP